MEEDTAGDNILIIGLPLLIIGGILIHVFIPRYEALVVLPVVAIVSPVALIGAFKIHDERRKRRKDPEAKDD